jgi:hypothetical protein
MASNLIQNPRGSFGGSAGPDLTKDSGGRTPVPMQKTGEAEDLDMRTAAPGGRILLADATPLPGKDIGVGSIGDGRKPFKLSGA